MPTGGMIVINWPTRQLMKKKLAIIADVVEPRLGRAQAVEKLVERVKW
jgi:hypothetical protein